MSRTLRMTLRPAAGILTGAGIWAAAVACCLLLSPIVAPSAAEHDCTGSDCAVCALLIAHTHLSDTAKPTPVFLTHAACRDVALKTVSPASGTPAAAVTLVSQKIKLTI